MFDDYVFEKLIDFNKDRRLIKTSKTKENSNYNF